MYAHQLRHSTISSRFPAKLMPRCLASVDSRLDAEAGITGLLLALAALPARKDSTAEAARIMLLERLADRLAEAVDNPAAVAGLSRIRDPFRHHHG